MKKLLSTFSYSIGKKLIMGLTGLLLIVFLVEHLIGNLLLLSGPQAFNSYAEFMGGNMIVRILEVGLFAGFLFHIVDGLWLWAQNRKARPVRYAVKPGNKNASWFSRNMATTGTVILIFLILHLATFFIDARFDADLSFGVDGRNYNVEGWASNPQGLNLGLPADATPGQVYEALGIPEHEDTSMYHKAAWHFSIPWYSAFYIVCMVLLAMHLVHGFQSVFQTLGFNHSKYTPIIKALGYGYAILIPAGLAAIPICFLINPIG
jgi:succinate dehydrogenase / fumarate reductase, cytochrome b subunit